MKDAVSTQPLVVAQTTLMRPEDQTSRTAIANTHRMDVVQTTKHQPEDMRTLDVDVNMKNTVAAPTKLAQPKVKMQPQEFYCQICPLSNSFLQYFSDFFCLQ